MTLLSQGGKIPPFSRYGQGDQYMSWRQILIDSGYDPDVAPFPGLMGPVFNAKAFGAVGNGLVADEAPAIQAAYMAMPSTGGRLFLPPGDYNFTTPLVFNTPGKYLLLEGVPGLTRLNYTPTTATTAITLDYVLLAGGGYVTGHGIRGIELTNGSCQTSGGCGSSATGVLLGNSLGGAQNGTLDGVKISGFGTGVTFGSAGLSWGMPFHNCSIVWNTIGIDIPVAFEGLSLLGGRVSVNGTGIRCNGSIDVYSIGTSFDNNTVWAIDITQGNFFGEGCHFEITAQAISPNFIRSLGGTVALFGGLLVDGGTTGNATRWVQLNGGLGQFWGTALSSGGRTVTSVVEVLGSSTVVCAFFNTNVAVLSTMFNTTTNVLDLTQLSTSVGRYRGVFQAKRFKATEGAVLVAGDFALSPGWGTSATVTGVLGTDQAWQVTVTSSGTGQAANPTLTITFKDGTWGSPPICISKTNGGSGPNTTLVDATTATTNVITFVGTPVAGNTHVITSVCMGRP